MNDASSVIQSARVCQWQMIVSFMMFSGLVAASPKIECIAMASPDTLEVVVHAAQAKTWHVSQASLSTIASTDQMRMISEVVSQLRAGDNAGIFYEISCGLKAHDNVIVGNGFALTRGAWGANGGISLSSSPQCLIERNLLVGNLEGFNFREQIRSTPRIEGKSEPVWNADQVIRHNVLAYNREAQVWGWFDIGDERHWPRSLQTKSDQSDTSHKSLSLEDLKLSLTNYLYCPGPGQDLFNWGVTCKGSFSLCIES